MFKKSLGARRAVNH
uniref:Uncharacterized protein n=1 Tax=Arundo donax TaxID=35708 RepID=A0A0A8YGZ0_ARUDO